MPRKTLSLIGMLAIASCAPGADPDTRATCADDGTAAVQADAIVPETRVPEASATVIRTATAAMETRYPKTRDEVIDDLVIFFETHDMDAADKGLSTEDVASCLSVVSGESGRELASAFESCSDLPSSCPGSCEGYVAASALLKGLDDELQVSAPDEADLVVIR